MNAPKAPDNQGEGSPKARIIDLKNPIPSPFEDDVPIIDLTNRINSPAKGVGRPAPPEADADSIPVASEEPLTMPENNRRTIDLLDDAIVFDDAVETDRHADDFVESLGLKIEGPAPGNVAAATAFHPGEGEPDAQFPSSEGDFESLAAAALSPEKIESLLERVIEKVYADRIEAIIVETAERVVKREIEEIKSVLMGDDGE